MHVIAAKAQCFYEALKPEYKDYMKQVKKNAKVLSDTLVKNGFKIISGGTDNHLILVDVKSVGVTGKDAEIILDSINITCNKNTIPNETESAMTTSGIRLGTPAMTTRGFKENEFIEVANIISEALKNKNDKNIMKGLKERVSKLTNLYPLY